MLTVLALVTDAYGGRGGIAQAARDVIGAMATDDRLTGIYVLPRHAPEAPLGLPENVAQTTPSPKRLAYTARVLARVIRAKPGLIFCNHIYMAPLAALAARLSGSKLVIQLHGIEIWQEPNSRQRKALEAADLLLCVSRDTRARALSHCDLTPERTVVLNNTVNPGFTLGDRGSAREKYGLSDEFALLIVGRLEGNERYKGHDRLIAELSDLTHPEGRPIVLLIAGDGDDRKRLEMKAAMHGVSDQVHFLGQVKSDDLPDLYRAADLFTLPSTGEGFGIVFLEAMASGTPALGLATGGAPDALSDGNLGSIVSADESLSSALQRAINARPLDRAKLAKDIRERFGEIVFRNRLASALNFII